MPHRPPQPSLLPIALSGPVAGTAGSDTLPEPLFAEPKHVGCPNLPCRQRLFERFNDILDRAWLSNNGRYVQLFEQQIRQITGARHCIAVSNGTMALSLTASAMGLTGEVIVPALTFIATPHAFAWLGVTPVFADVDPVTCCIDPAHVEELISERTTAIVGVHLWGRPCDVIALQQIAQRHNLRLIFDASHAFGCETAGAPIGTFGDAETFSFHATKFVSAAEGGAIVTNNDLLADSLRRARNFGFSGVDEVTELGTNAKLNELSAAFGVTSLESMSEFIEHNARNYAAFQQGLADIPGLQFVPNVVGRQHNFQYVVIRVDASVTGICRDDLMGILHENNIRARRYFYPGCHRSQPYCQAAQPRLPVTEQLVTEVLSLPTGSSVAESDVAAICGLIRSVIDQASRGRQRLVG